MKIETMKELFGEFIPAEMWDRLSCHDEGLYSLEFDTKDKFHFIGGVKFNYVCLVLSENKLAFFDTTDSSEGTKAVATLSYELILGNTTLVMAPNPE